MAAFRRFPAALALACLPLRLASADPDKPVAEVKEVAATPEDAWKQFQAAVGKKDKERTWALLGSASRKVLEEQIGTKMKASEGQEREDAAKELGITVEEYDKLSTRDLVLSIVFLKASEPDGLMKMSIKDIKVDGDKAEGKRVEGEDKTRPAFFVKEEGEWKLDVKREMEADQDEMKEPESTPPDDGKEK